MDNRQCDAQARDGSPERGAFWPRGELRAVVWYRYGFRVAQFRDFHEVSRFLQGSSSNQEEQERIGYGTLWLIACSSQASNGDISRLHFNIHINGVHTKV